MGLHSGTTHIYRYMIVTCLTCLLGLSSVNQSEKVVDLNNILFRIFLRYRKKEPVTNLCSKFSNHRVFHWSDFMCFCL